MIYFKSSYVFVRSIEMLIFGLYEISLPQNAENVKKSYWISNNF